MKKCIKCKIEKNLIDFKKAKQNKDGFTGVCKVCLIEYNRNNIEKIKETQKKYRLNNKEKRNEYSLEWKKNNINYYKEYQKKYMKIYYKKRIKIDPLFKLKCNIRSLILISIKKNGYTKKSKSHQILGCSFEEFKIYLEKQFTNGMNWSNAGEWHLDHIYPVSLAKDEAELIALNYYTNFQPLWALDNFKKGNKIV